MQVLGTLVQNYKGVISTKNKIQREHTMAQADWRSFKRPSHLTTRQPRKPRQPSNVSYNGVMWMTFALTIGVFFVFT